MNDNDCPECAAFAKEMRAALVELFGKPSDRSRSSEQAQAALARYLSLSEEAVVRLRESFRSTKAGQVYARFIGTSHHFVGHHASCTIDLRAPMRTPEG